jgi:hypothetical protein
MNRATDRADAKPGPAEIEVIRAVGPVPGAHAKHVFAVHRFHGAHRAVAALAGFQAGKIMPTLGRLPEYFRRNAEHYLKSSPLFSDFDRTSAQAY